jgi:aryl-alcohol dehydrogenase-like predicted oxidoreductase
VQVLRDAAGELGTTVDALALAAIMAQPFAPMVLSGASTVQQLESNAAALQLAGRLEGPLLQRLMGGLRQEPAEYWQERSQLAWN